MLARLTHVEDGSQIWGGDYDRETRDLFDLQREIAGEIAKQVGGELMHAEYMRMRHVDPKHLDAAEAVQQIPPLLDQHRSHPVTLLLRGSLALCQLRIGAEEEAISVLRECYESAPGLPIFATSLATLLLRRGEAEEALRIAGHLAELGFDISDDYRERWRALGPTVARMEELFR